MGEALSVVFLIVKDASPSGWAAVTVWIPGTPLMSGSARGGGTEEGSTRSPSNSTDSRAAGPGRWARTGNQRAKTRDIEFSFDLRNKGRTKVSGAQTERQSLAGHGRTCVSGGLKPTAIGQQPASHSTLRTRPHQVLPRHQCAVGTRNPRTLFRVFPR